MSKFNIEKIEKQFYDFKVGNSSKLTLSEVESLLGGIHDYFVTYDSFMREFVKKEGGVKIISKSTLFAFVHTCFKRKGLMGGKSRKGEGGWIDIHGSVARPNRRNPNGGGLQYGSPRPSNRYSAEYERALANARVSGAGFIPAPITDEDIQETDGGEVDIASIDSQARGWNGTIATTGASGSITTTVDSGGDVIFNSYSADTVPTPTSRPMPILAHPGILSQIRNAEEERDIIAEEIEQQDRDEAESERENEREMQQQVQANAISIMEAQREQLLEAQRAQIIQGRATRTNTNQGIQDEMVGRDEDPF